MKWNAMHAVPRSLCAFVAAGTMFVMLSGARALAQAQGAEQKPAQSYQTIYLKNITDVREMNDVVTDLRNMLPRARMYQVGSANAISIKVPRMRSQQPRRS